ncbi:hypothetical protein ACQ4LE_010473 [Meloidogyne hapla]
MYSINIFLLYVFSTLLLFKFINAEKCLKQYAIGCDDTTFTCCKGLQCQRTYANNDKKHPRWQCLESQCNNDKCDKKEDKCCYGSLCVDGKCEECAQDGEYCHKYKCCNSECKMVVSKDGNFYMYTCGGCLKLWQVGCDDNYKRCCKGLSCQRTFINNNKDSVRYQCLESPCQIDTCDVKEDRCCYGSLCVNGKCQQCTKNGDSCYKDRGSCCVGKCSKIDEMYVHGYKCKLN